MLCERERRKRKCDGEPDRSASFPGEVKLVKKDIPKSLRRSLSEETTVCEEALSVTMRMF